MSETDTLAWLVLRTRPTKQIKDPITVRLTDSTAVVLNLDQYGAPTVRAMSHLDQRRPFG
jgi:hypothetical protein